MSKHLPSVPDGEFLLYQTEDGRIRIEPRMQEETVWLTQDQMAQLFGKAKPTHYYNLDVIISVGYRVKSLRGTQFRREHLNDPSPVEGHFREAVKELKQLEESQEPSDKDGSK